MATVVSVNPFSCRMWALHERLQSHITEESCRVEIESFAKHGQLVQVLGRRLNGDPEHQIELIFGARSLFIARLLNKPLLVELRQLTDREGIIAMDMENRHRTDISPYERGVSYERWLRGGHFSSQEEITRALNISASQVSRLLRLAQLPAVVVGAFENGADICEGWGLDLMRALEDPERRQRTLQLARSIRAQSPRLPPREVYRRLMAAPARGRKVKAADHDEVVKGDSGDPLFRIRYQRRSIAVLLPAASVSSSSLARMRDAVETILKGSKPGVIRG